MDQVHRRAVLERGEHGSARRSGRRSGSPPRRPPPALGNGLREHRRRGRGCRRRCTPSSSRHGLFGPCVVSRRIASTSGQLNSGGTSWPLRQPLAQLRARHAGGPSSPMRTGATKPCRRSGSTRRRRRCAAPASSAPGGISSKMRCASKAVVVAHAGMVAGRRSGASSRSSGGTRRAAAPRAGRHSACPADSPLACTTVDGTEVVRASARRWRAMRTSAGMSPGGRAEQRMDEHAVADLDRDLGEAVTRARQCASGCASGRRQRATSQGRRTVPRLRRRHVQVAVLLGKPVCDSTFTGPARLTSPGPSPCARRGCARVDGANTRTHRALCRWRTSRAPPSSPGECPSSGSSSTTCWPSDRAGGPRTRRQRDRDRPNSPSTRCIVRSHAEPVVARHEALERRERAPMPSISRSPRSRELTRRPGDSPRGGARRRAPRPSRRGRSRLLPCGGTRRLPRRRSWLALPYSPRGGRSGAAAGSNKARGPRPVERIGGRAANWPIVGRSAQEKKRTILLRMTGKSDQFAGSGYA